MATSYFNNFQLQQNKLPGMGMYGLPPFYGDFYGEWSVMTFAYSSIQGAFMIMTRSMSAVERERVLYSEGV